MIRKVGKNYKVYSEDGKHFGTYPTEEEAKKRIAMMEYFKHKKARGGK